MQSALLKSICQMGIFMICAQAIIHFKPDKSYGKYLKMLVSVMILIQIFAPISSLFTKNTMEDVQTSVELFEERLEESMESAAKSAYLSEGILEKVAMNEVEDLETTKEEGINGEAKEEGKRDVTVEKIQIKVGAGHETE